MRGLKLKVCLVLMFLLIIVFPNNSFGKTMVKNKASAKIISVENVSITIKQFQKYNLPTKVNVRYDNKKTSTSPVRWNVSKINTNEIGTFIYYGNIPNYTKYAKLTLKVIPFVTSVNNIEETINTNEVFNLPESIKATFNDNVERDVHVDWDQSDISTSKSGVYTFNGKIASYDKSIKCTLNILNSVAKINNINVTINQKQPYNLPEKIDGILINGTHSDLNVSWNTGSIDTNVTGTYDYTGIVIGYEGVVHLILNVVPTIDSIQDKSIEFHVGEQYELPKTVEAKMSDESTKNVPVTWNPSTIDITKIGQYKIIGKVDGYNKAINYNINIRTGFFAKNECYYSIQRGYIAVDYSKNFGQCTNPNKIEIRSEDGIVAHPISIEIATDYKYVIMLTTTMKFDSNKKYTLFIPKGICKSVDGDVTDEDITIPIVIMN